MTARPPAKTLIASGVLMSLFGTTLALASPAATRSSSGRIAAVEAAHSAASAGRCVPGTLNRSALLPGTSLSVSPLPGSYDASPRTQISLLGAPPGALSSVSVSGSQSGSHPGRLRPYSQGDGASFVPSRPFSSGETVTVRGKLSEGGHTKTFTYSFAVARQLAVTYAASAQRAPSATEVQHFRSLPTLHPPTIVVTARSPQTAPGYVFAAPYAGHGQHGPMIFDEAGNLVWFFPLTAGTEATNLQVEQLEGRPVLTWWQGHIPQQGFGQGEEVIADSSYRVIDRVHAGNGFSADLHDFHITPRDTAVVTVFSPIYCNLSAVRGPSGGAVTDSLFQEIDLRTGLVRSEWHSLDHVPLSDSYSSPSTASAQWPFDYFHINSIDQQPDGTTLISARNTSALYELGTSGGQVLTRIGGRHSDVKLAAGAATAYQHDATALADGTISIFDNGAVPKVHAQSRGIVMALNQKTSSATLVAQYEHPTALSAGSQGNIQLLGNQDVFVGWGAQPYFSEFNAAGQLLFDAHMHGSYQSYRAYRFAWAGTPTVAPAAAALTSGAGGALTVYASWNGDTRTAGWRVLAGPSPQRLAPVASGVRTGFETALAAPGPEPYVAVQALDASGAVLGVSPTIRG